MENFADGEINERSLSNPHPNFRASQRHPIYHMDDIQDIYCAKIGRKLVMIKPDSTEWWEAARQMLHS